MERYGTKRQKHTEPERWLLFFFCSSANILCSLKILTCYRGKNWFNVQHNWHLVRWLFPIFGAESRFLWFQTGVSLQLGTEPASWTSWSPSPSTRPCSGSAVADYSNIVSVLPFAVKLSFFLFYMNLCWSLILTFFPELLFYSNATSSCV
jgi:hypothetical protein